MSQVNSKKRKRDTLDSEQAYCSQYNINEVELILILKNLN